MKTVIAVFLVGVVAISASQGVNIVNQNPEIDTGFDALADKVREGLATLRAKILEARKNILSDLGVNVVDNNTPAPDSVQVVDNSVNGVNVVDNSPSPGGNIVDDTGFYQPTGNSKPEPAKPLPGFDNADSAFYQPGISQGVDTGFYRPPRPNVKPPRPGGGNSDPDRDVYYTQNPWLRGGQ